MNPVVDVGHYELPPVTGTGCRQQVEQDHGIGATGHGNEKARPVGDGETVLVILEAGERDVGKIRDFAL